MILTKNELRTKIAEMIQSFQKEHERVINPEIFESMIEKSEVIIDEIEISSENEIKIRIETAVNKVISELVNI